MPGKGIRQKERRVIIKLFRAGLSCREIGDRVDRQPSSVRQALVRWGERAPCATPTVARYTPTPKEIRIACAKYRDAGKKPMPVMSANLAEMLIGWDETRDRYSTRRPDQALEAKGG